MHMKFDLLLNRVTELFACFLTQMRTERKKNILFLTHKKLMSTQSFDKVAMEKKNIRSSSFFLRTCPTKNRQKKRQERKKERKKTRKKPSPRKKDDKLHVLRAL